MKKTICLLVCFIGLWLYHLPLKAPEVKCLFIKTSEGIDPFTKVWNAVCDFESSMDPLAYNDRDPNGGSHGIGQIGLQRLHEYNTLTNNNYLIKDLYNPIISKKIFMYYAMRIGPYDIDLVIRRWNGSGPLTYQYLKEVKKRMKP